MTTEKRRELDPTFKQVLTQFLATLPVIVETEVEVSRLPRTIDVLVVAKTKQARDQLRLKTPFHHFRSHNQIEFKGQHDRLTVWNYMRILGRSHFYMGDNKVPFDEMCVTIVCAGKPRTVLESQISPHIFTRVGEGRYQQDGSPQVTILVINELPTTPENYLLLLFAGSKKKFREFLTQALIARQFVYVEYAYIVRPQVTKELLEMAGIYTIPRENLEFIAQDIGEQLIELMDPDIILKRLNLSEILRGLKPEERLQGLKPEERLVGLSSADMAILAQKIAEETRWRELQALTSAEKRIAFITNLPPKARAFILNTTHRSRLLQDLDAKEQALLIAWVEE